MEPTRCGQAGGRRNSGWGWKPNAASSSRGRDQHLERVPLRVDDVRAAGDLRRLVVVAVAAGGEPRVRLVEIRLLAEPDARRS